MNILISESEKERILGMHRNAIKKEFLFEYNTPGPTPVPIVSPKTPEVPVMTGSADANLRADLEARLKETEALTKALRSNLNKIDADQQAAQQIEKTKTQTQLVNNTIAGYETKINQQCKNLRIIGDGGQKNLCRDWRNHLRKANNLQLELMSNNSGKEDNPDGEKKTGEKVLLALQVVAALAQTLVMVKMAFPGKSALPTPELGPDL